MGVKPSMGTVGDAYDNAMAESFLASLECELINRRSWQTKSQARLAVFTWIESWYNPLRRHSGINYKSPNNFEKALNDEEIESIQQTPKRLHPRSSDCPVDGGNFNFNFCVRQLC